MNDADFIKVVSASKSKSDICRSVGFPINGWGLKRVGLRIQSLGLDVSHFDTTGKEKRRKWPVETKTCPVCEQSFQTNGSNRNQVCCSVSCSNKLQPRGSSLEISNYRTICFRIHKKECVVCGEKNIVSVHHYDENYDENHDNNAPENLIPLCPTHHTYIHSEYRAMIEDKVEIFRKKFLSSLREKVNPSVSGTEDKLEHYQQRRPVCSSTAQVER